MPSIGLISPTRFRRSAIVNVPGWLDGNLGFPVQALLPEVGLVIAMHEADEDFGD